MQDPIWVLVVQKHKRQRLSHNVRDTAMSEKCKSKLPGDWRILKSNKMIRKL